MDENRIFDKLSAIYGAVPNKSDKETSDLSRKVAQHKLWLQTIRHERPSTSKNFKIGVYIRYFNQTKYEDYLNNHIKQFTDTVSMCPNWQIVDFYVDNGSTAPNMENAPEWSRLLSDAMEGKVNLILTQKVSNVSKKPIEITICARLLAAQNPPIGIYFISEDIFTLASYYMDDLRDTAFFPDKDWRILPDNNEEAMRLLGVQEEIND